MRILADVPIVAGLVRWWRFVKLVRSPEQELALSPDWRSPRAGEKAAWDRVRQARGIRRASLRPQPRRAPQGAQGAPDGR